MTMWLIAVLMTQTCFDTWTKGIAERGVRKERIGIIGEDDPPRIMVKFPEVPKSPQTVLQHTTLNGALSVTVLTRGAEPDFKVEGQTDCYDLIVSSSAWPRL